MKSFCAFLAGCLLGGLVIAVLDRPLIEEQSDRIWLLEGELARSKDLVRFCDDVVGAVYPYGTKR